jgi:titin
MQSPRVSRRVAHAAAAVLVVLSTLTPLAGLASASSTLSQTFNYTGSTQTFTVPDGVTSLTVTLTGGQGGRGGGDSQGSPTPGGYRGVVTGTIDVTPGQVLTVAVGGGGGTGTSSQGSAPGGSAGLNPLEGYDGAVGGTAGPAGSSGGGGGSGAATVLRVDGVDIVAGGAGGNGGNGQFLPIVGRRAESTHTPRVDATSTTGRIGKNTSLACSPGFNCDGGASGAGGGGAQGGEQGDVQYGGASATEYFGFGGFPGSSSTAGFEGLGSFYEYYAGNSANGSIVISYEDGTPGAPRSVSGAPGPNRVQLNWLPPTSSGSSAITDYVVQYSTSAGGTYTTFDDGVSTGTSALVTGLTNGTTYFFKVAAVNAVGTGPASAAMAQGVMASDVPGTPTITTVTPIDGGLQVDVTPGATDRPVTSWEFRLTDGDWQSASAVGNRLTLSGLRNGTSYEFQVRALNAVGASNASAPGTGTPRAVPSAPGDLSAVASDRAITLSWSAPASDNGAAVTDYVVQRATSSTGPWTTVSDGVSTATTTTVTGLTNGTRTFLRVAAVNAAGTGATSALAEATPFTTPDAVAIAGLAAADGALVVDLSPTSDGGAALSRYEYQLDGDGPWISTGAAAEPFRIEGLVNGRTYGVQVRAVNAAGTGPASASVNGTPRTTPAAPSISAVALDTGAVQVTFTLGSDGGSPITNLQYSIDDGDTWVTRSPASVASPLTISGLVGGETYAVRLRAVNAQGSGSASNESLVTAKGTPEAPELDSVVPGDKSLVLNVTPGPNGGSAITNYEYSLDDGATWTTRSPASPASPLLIGGLDNGTEYDVRVRAVNAAGSGAASPAVSATPRTTPGAPTIDADTISGVGGELDVEFSPPSSNGGSPILTYEYSTDAGATWRTRSTGSTASPLRIDTLSSDGVTPLVGGQSYPVEIRAVNAAGAGAASAVADGITTTEPGAPVIDTIELAGSSARVTFDPPANGGAAIIRYEYRLDGGTWTDTGSTAPEVVLTGLSSAGSYDIELRAVNSVGAGPASAPGTISVRTTPGAPTVDDVIAGDGSLSVAFTPGDDGGAAITGYQYSTDGGVTWRTRTSGTTASPLVITTTSGTGDPLVNGRLYTVQIRALNVAGAGAASTSTLRAPQGTPDAPTDVVLTPGDGSLSVAFVPGADGGSSVTRIEYRLDGGTWIDSGALSSPLSISGLTNGTSYDVELRAVSALGAGDASSPVAGTPRTLAAAPGAVAAVSGDSTATITWAAPLSDGGAPVTSYVATLYDQSVAGIPLASCTTSDLGCLIEGLDNGTTYYVGVIAVNAAGTSPASAPRVAVRPLGAPVVEISSITPGATSLSVDVTTDDGGAPLSSYEYRLDGGPWVSAATTAEPFTISGLVTGQAYSVQVRALNSVGAGPASGAVSATPRTLPGAPIALSANGVAASAELNWERPISDGGAPITDYVMQYATNVNGPFTTFSDGTSPLTSAVVTGLTNGTTYFFRVAAVNAAGTGASSSLASATPLAAPSAPNLTGLTAGSLFLQAAFTAPSSNGGSAITGYQYQLDGGEWRNVAGTTSPLTIPGLTNGQTYSVAIRAVNAVGGGAASNVRTGTPYGLPSGVKGFVASPTSNSVQLSWDAANANGSPITAYSIIRWSARTEGSIAASYSTTATSYEVTGLGAGTYYFTIEATNAAGTGPRSSPRASSTVGATVPAAPTITSAVVRDGVANLTWTSGAAGTSAISGHVVQYERSGVRTTLVESATAGTSATVTLPSDADPYSLRVASLSAAGIGAFSTVSPALVDNGGVSDVSTDAATVFGDVHANGGTATVSVEYATDAADLGTPEATVVVATPSSVSGSVVAEVAAGLTGLAPGTTYHARVRAVSGAATTLGATSTFTTAASLSTSGLDVVYDGEPVVLDTVTSPVGLDIERSFVGIDGTDYPETDQPPTDAGTYRVTTSIVDDELSGTEVVELVIRRRALSLDVQAVDRAYDGTTSVELDTELSGVLDGDDVQLDPAALVADLDDPSAGESRNVTITTVGSLLVGDDADNYTVTAPTSATVDIARATQTLRFTSVAPAPLRVGSTYTPVVSSDLGLPVQLSVLGDPDEGDTDPCVLVGGVVVGVAPGSCVIVAGQPGNDDVEAASTIGQFVTVAAVVVDPDPEPPTTTPPSTTPPTTAPTAPAPTTTAPPASAPSRSVGTPASGGANDARFGLSGDGAEGVDGTGSATGSDGSVTDATAGTAEDASATSGLLGADPIGPAAGDERSTSDADDDAEGATSLGEEVAGIDQEAADDEDRGPVLSLISSAGDQPIVLFVLALLLAIGAWWIVARRRTSDDQE